MSFFRMNAAALVVGFLLDLALGDPEGWPHPVILMGRYISFAERRLRRRGGDLRRSALLLTGSTVGLSMALTALLLGLLGRVHRGALFAGMCVLSWQALSARCLAREAGLVEKALSRSLVEGRRQVARIVGRDTSGLSEEEVVAATVETVAENTTDGVISPMLYLLLGGPVLAMGFKAASTLDSMVGYLDERYRDIGWSSAKLDDALNYLPARLCGPLLCVSAQLCGLDGANAWRVLLRDRRNHLSPNCAWSEAAAAGALHIRLGGTHLYFGKPVVKPTIGDADRPAEPQDIGRAVRLMYGASVLMLILMIIGGFLL